ncbi:MAG: hypothetical protein M1813_008699 [Trichoglossum hirsutum]|nr:MAG: hypothetical protein M1813_008699 [Trichoglossum hirsutum]
MPAPYSWLLRAPRDDRHPNPYYRNNQGPNELDPLPSPLLVKGDMSAIPAEGLLYDPELDLEDFRLAMSPDIPGSSIVDPEADILDDGPSGPFALRGGCSGVEVACVLQRWFKNSWGDKAQVVNAMFGWDYSANKLRYMHLVAKRNREEGWRIVYEDCRFDEIYWWGELVLELTKNAEQLGIELVLRDGDLTKNLETNSTHKGRYHRWTAEQKTTLCLLRTTLGDIGSDNTQLIMAWCFSEMANVTQWEIEMRFKFMTTYSDPLWLATETLTKTEKVEEYPVIMSKIHAAAKALYTPSE